MGIIVIGGNAGGYENVDSDHHAFENPRQPAFGTLGYYRSVNRTGNIAANSAAGTILWTMRWSDATRFALITRISMIAQAASIGISAGVITPSLYFARNYTVNATGGTSYAPAHRMQMLRTQPMDDSLVQDFRIATTVGLTAGTWKLDAQPLYVIAGFASIAGGVTDIFADGISAYMQQQYTTNGPPIVLAQNEGLVIQLLTTGGGADSIDFGIEVFWAEVFSY